MKVLSFGEILLRLASPGYTKLFQKDSLDATFCGGEANVAVSLANFGVQSEFLTVVPDNDVGRASLNALRYFGVDTSKTFFKNGRMGLYYLEKGASQRPSKVIYDRAYSSIALAEPTDFDWEALFDVAIDPEKARAYRASSKPEKEDTCSMCGNFCAVKNMNKIMEGEIVSIFDE